MFHMDCLTGMKNMSDNSTDLVLTSPPYNMNLRISTRPDGSIRHHSRQVVKEISTKYQNFDDNLPMEDYFDFNRRALNEMLRAAPLVFYNIQVLTGNKSAVFKLLGEFSDCVKEVIIWDKQNAEPAISTGVLNSQFEFLIVFAKGRAASRKFENAQFGRGQLSNVWSVKRGSKTNKAHGAVFPAALADIVIGNFTTPGQTVLDPFMGTGTTAESAVKLGRNFIGYEIDESYYNFAQQRALEAQTLALVL